jgi:hypothetical protein
LIYGGSYIVRINFVRQPTWAGSNIYWDDNLYPERAALGATGGLTFAPAGTPYNDSKQQYQGVYFLPGSLVGISPESIGGDKTWTAGNTLYTPHYDPDDPASSTWSPEHTTLFYTIPYVSDNSSGEVVDYFATYEEYEANKGDICRYLSWTNPGIGNYRMPTIGELWNGKHKNDASGGAPMPKDWVNAGPIAGWWTRVGGSTEWTTALIGSTRDADGTTAITIGAYFSDLAFFPASMARMPSNGNIYEDLGGFYWSSSLNSGGNFYDINIRYTELSNNPTAPYAESIRCVKADN